jgi:hypothetical protein
MSGKDKSDLPKKDSDLEPWECCDAWETEAQYFNWIRGAMRKAWCRHPVKITYMNAHRFKAPLGKITFKYPNGTPVWATHCETCGKLFKVGKCEVDHKARAGGCKSWDEFNVWIKSLLHINLESLAIICKPCHYIKSYAEQHDMTFEEARIAKKAIAFMKQKAPAQIKWLEAKGFSSVDTQNETNRKAAYTRYLQATSESKK